MQTLADGNTLVGYGGVPAISEYGRDGTLLFDAHLPFDMFFYRAYRRPWSAQPADPAGGGREPQQHERRDDRARQLERRHGRGRAGACSRAPSACGARGAGDDRGGRLRELAILPRSALRVRCRRSTPRAGCSEARRAAPWSATPRRCRARAASGMSRQSTRRSVGRFGGVLVERRRGLLVDGSSSRLDLPPHPAIASGGAPGRRGSLAWRSVAFFSWAGLHSSLEGSAAHPTRRPRAPNAVGRARHERRDDERIPPAAARPRRAGAHVRRRASAGCWRSAAWRSSWSSST